MNELSATAYTIKEFCAAYRISKPKFYRMVHDGTAPQSIKIGGTRRIPFSAAKAWEERFLGDTVIAPEVSRDRRERLGHG